MKLDGYLGKWGMPNLGALGVHEDDRGNFEDYPFKSQWHKCIGFYEGYLVIQFSCLQIRVLEKNFRVIAPPDFLPFDNVSYISSKGKLEIGTVVSYSTLRKPALRNVYILSVKGKVKSTLYEKERLTLIEDAPEVIKKREGLSKIISHALRHKPDKYGLELDPEGWVEMESLIQALKHIDNCWQSLMYYDILKMIDLSDKKRHEVKAQRIGPEYKNEYGWYIRAKYGHSFDGKIYNEKQEPPRVLYHGTTSTSADIILREGLSSMDRQYVHLSQKMEEAVRVGKRRQSQPVILEINAKKAFEGGCNFYLGNDEIWLSDFIPPRFIKEYNHTAYD